jgi:hypothetical protein
MESGKMCVGIMVDDEMNAFHKLIAPHREIALDYHRDHPAVFRHYRHVEVHMTTPDGTIAEQILEDTGDFFVGDFRIFGTGCKSSGSSNLSPGHETRCDQAGGGAKEATASWMVGLGHRSGPKLGLLRC